MRTLYEKINIYVYVIVPVIFLIIHCSMVNFFKLNLFSTNSFNTNSFEFVLAMLSVLLTIFGLMFTLPDNNYRKLMKKYNHDKIIFNTIFCGIISSLSFILLYIIEISSYLQELLFIIIFSEVVIATWWIFRTLKNIGE